MSKAQAINDMGAAAAAAVIKQLHRPCSKQAQHICNVIRSLSHVCLASSDEPHCVFDCLRLDGLQLSFARLLDDAHCAKRISVWPKDHMAVSALVLAICTEALTLKQMCRHRPLLAEWR